MKPKLALLACTILACQRGAPRTIDAAPPSSAIPSATDAAPPIPPETSRVRTLRDLNVALSADGKRVLYLGGDERTPSGLFLYDVMSGRMIERTPLGDDPATIEHDVESRLAREPFHPMSPLFASPPRCASRDPRIVQRIDDGDIHVRYSFPSLDVSRDVHSILARDVSAWSPNVEPACKPINHLVLDKAWVDAERTAMAIVLSYCDADLCPELPDRLVVFSLVPGR